MKKELFNELKKSIRQGGKILKGKMKPGREFKFDSLNPKLIRKKLGLSQGKFASLMGISSSTLQNWEQGRRKPEGPAKVLLAVTYKFPEAVLEAVYNRKK